MGGVPSGPPAGLVAPADTRHGSDSVTHSPPSALQWVTRWGGGGTRVDQLGQLHGDDQRLLVGVVLQSHRLGRLWDARHVLLGVGTPGLKVLLLRLQCGV